jgi:hypothetical protein
LPATIGVKGPDGKEAASSSGVTRSERRTEMTSKSKRRPSCKLKSLKLKSVGKSQAKQIKGGPTGPQWIKKTLLQQS